MNKVSICLAVLMMLAPMSQSNADTKTNSRLEFSGNGKLTIYGFTPQGFAKFVYSFTHSYYRTTDNMPKTIHLNDTMIIKQHWDDPFSFHPMGPDWGQIKRHDDSIRYFYKVDDGTP